MDPNMIYPNNVRFQINNWSPRSLKARLGYLRETSKQSVFFFFTPLKNNMEPHGTPKTWGFRRWCSFSKGWLLGSMLVFQGITCRTRELKLHTKPGSQIVSNNARHCHVWPKDPAMMAKQRAENKLTFGKCQLGWPFYHYCGHLFKGSFNTSFPGGVFNLAFEIYCSSNWIPFPKNQGENKKQLNTFGTIEHRKLMVGRNIPLKIDGRWTFLSKWPLFRGFFV